MCVTCQDLTAFCSFALQLSRTRLRKKRKKQANKQVTESHPLAPWNSYLLIRVRTHECHRLLNPPKQGFEWLLNPCRFQSVL